MWSIHFCFYWWKNYKNRPRNARVIVENMWFLFMEHRVFSVSKHSLICRPTRKSARWYFLLWDTKHSNVTGQNEKKTKLLVALTSAQLKMSWIGPHPVLWLLQCRRTSFPLQNQEQRFGGHLELSWLDVHGALSCMNTKSPYLNRWESNKRKMGRNWWPN